MDLKFTIDDTKISDAVSAAILAQMDEATRARLLEESIKHIISAPPKRDHWGTEPKSPLREAFDAQLGMRCHEIAKEFLATDEASAKVRDTVRDAMHALLSSNDLLGKEVSHAAPYENPQKEQP